MSLLIGIQDLSKSFGTQDLFQDISFSIFINDHIGLIGPNGSGKSTLLKILAGQEVQDSGSISKKQGMRIGYASQAPEFPALPLEEILIAHATDHKDQESARIQARIILGKVGFQDSMKIATELSGGWKKRLDIARALINQPDLLLLDEPTNHLDLEGIEWLEGFLFRERLTFIVISHDRYFLENISSKVIEINKCYPQGIFTCDGNYSTFLERKEHFLESQQQQEKTLKYLVREEIDWLRRSPKARTTKSQARIQRAHGLIDELASVRHRNKTPKVELEFAASDRETRKLLVGKNLTKSLGQKMLFKGIDLTLSPGSRLGIAGANGTGKTTLLKILAGEMAPDLGTIKQADDLKLVYFDQHREKIAPDVTLKRALSPINDTVNYRGQSIHVNGWARKFLFSADRLELPIGCLSGGERARIQIARLMLEPADILFLDEPTNDLDIQTLEVIEQSLIEFPGAVVLISHDRCLMDRVCTQVLGLGSNCDSQIFADYSQWEEASKAKAKNMSKEAKQSPLAPSSKEKPSKKLSYKESKELEGMEANILQAEKLCTALQQQLDDETVARDSTRSLELYQQLAQAQQTLEHLFERWQELEHKSKS